MPFELVADYAHVGLPAADVRWGKIATALTTRMLAAEPRLRIVLRALPPAGQPKHLVYRIKPEDAKTLGPLRSRCEIPEGRWALIYQYFCKSPGCARANGDKRWFPQAHLPLHKGHDIERSAPTGRSQKFPWQPTFRLFFGAPDKLAGSVPVMAAGCVTDDSVTDEQIEGLRRFDWIWFLVRDFKSETSMDLLRRAAKINIQAGLLGADPHLSLLAWMRGEDPKLLEPEAPESEEDEAADGEAAAEAIRRRLRFVTQLVASKSQQLQGEAAAKAGQLQQHAAAAMEQARAVKKPG